MVDWRKALDATVKVIGFILTIVVSGGVVFFVRKTFADSLGKVLKDGAIVKALTSLTVVPLVIEGATVAPVRYV